MKTNLLSVAAIFALALFSNKMSAQATASATATATIVSPITITNAGNMNFGIIAKGTGGTVVLTPAGVRTATGTTLQTGGTTSAASFTVGGQGTYTYGVTLPSTAYTITNTTAGTETMTLTAFSSNPSGTAGVISGAITANGTQTLLVGATLNVNSTQASGVYTNATGFPVTVNYN